MKKSQQLEAIFRKQSADVTMLIALLTASKLITSGH